MILKSHLVSAIKYKYHTCIRFCMYRHMTFNMLFNILLFNLQSYCQIYMYRILNVPKNMSDINCIVLENMYL